MMCQWHEVAALTGECRARRKSPSARRAAFFEQCHLVKQMAEEEYLREKMIYRKESHLLFFAVRQKDRWTSASK